MVRFFVRAQSLGQVAGLLQSAVLTFDAQVAAAESTVTSIVNSSWKGEDAEKFHEFWTQWKAQSLLVRTALTGLQMQLLQAESGYTSNEVKLGTGFASRRQQTVEAIGSRSAAMQSRVVTGQHRSEDVEERDRVEAEQLGEYGRFFAGGYIATQANAGGAPDDTEDDKDVAEA